MTSRDTTAPETASAEPTISAPDPPAAAPKGSRRRRPATDEWIHLAVESALDR
jgi:hypothetical protein